MRIPVLKKDYRRRISETFDETKADIFVPAEWQRHEATWLGWPHNKEDWPGNTPDSMGLCRNSKANF